MANDKNTGFWKRLAFTLLGPASGREVLAAVVRKQTAHLPMFSFPLDAAAVRRVLVILPPEQLRCCTN